jgi:hypothetical protein
MSYQYASSSSTLPRVIVLILGLGTVSRWTMCVVSNRSAAETESQLCAQVASLHQIQMDLLNEKEQFMVTEGELNRTGTEVSLTGSVNTSTIDAQALAAATAQKALSKCEYDPLKADGIVGLGTQRAVTAFQQANNLHVHRGA